MKYLLAALTLAIIVALIAARQLIHEDSVLWNCLLMGNHQCGADHLAGFIIGRK